MNSAVALFLARMLLLVLLYLFLLLVVRALRSDLRAMTRRAGDAAGVAARAPRPPVPAAGPPRRYELEVMDGGQTSLSAGERVPVRDPLLIGRSSTNDVALEDDWVSSQHVRLRARGGVWLAEDLGSTNGTRVNDQPIKGATRVKPGDVLQIGRVKLKVVEGS